MVQHELEEGLGGHVGRRTARVRARTLVCLGAGKVSRGLVAPTFASAGYRIVFVDRNARVVDTLQREGSYIHSCCDPRGGVRKVRVRGVRAVSSGTHLDDAVEHADLMSVSVGKRGLEDLLPQLVAPLSRRRRPLDLLVAENLPHSDEFVRSRLEAAGLSRDVFARLGIVRTSVDRICPIAGSGRRPNPLHVLTEAHAEFVIDGTSLRTELGEVPGVMVTTDIEAYAERKLLVFNLGHAALAYLGYEHSPEKRWTREVARIPAVRAGTIAAMSQSGAAVGAKHRNVFSRREMLSYLRTSFERMRNRYLDDSVYRVGRDVQRKLGPTDRVLGAMRLAETEGLPSGAIARVFRAALGFAACDPTPGASVCEPRLFGEAGLGPLAAGTAGWTGLSPVDPVESRVLASLERLLDGTEDDIDDDPLAAFAR